MFKTYLNMDSLFGTWMMAAAAAALLTAILYPFVRVIVRHVSDGLERRRHEDHARAVRQGLNKPIRVRQTDLVQNMSAADKTQHQRAEALLAANQIREAAQIFEAINFQRRAVDILEQAGLIDEACHILLRLKATNRVAILYERNGMLAKAAHFFIEAADYVGAAKVYQKLGRNDYHCLQLAADNFHKAGKPRERLDALAELLASQAITDICTADSNWEFLAHYMQLRTVIGEVFERLAAAHVPAVCAALGQTPRAMAILASWAESSASAKILTVVLRYSTRSEELTRHFLAALSQGSRNELRANLDRLGLPPEQAVCLRLALQQKQALAA